jgi:hypothetical protein
LESTGQVIVAKPDLDLTIPKLKQLKRRFVVLTGMSGFLDDLAAAPM